MAGCDLRQAQPPGVDCPDAYNRWCGFLVAENGKDLAQVYDEATAQCERTAEFSHV